MQLLSEVVVLGQPDQGQWKYSADVDVLNWEGGLLGGVGVHTWRDQALTPRMLCDARSDDAIAEYVAGRFGGLAPRPFVLEHWAEENGLQVTIRLAEAELKIDDTYTVGWAGSPLVLAQDFFTEMVRAVGRRLSGVVMIRDTDLPKSMRGKGLALCRQVEITR
ncbi:MAG TPA: hypothetical protein QF873_00980 [Patescibacteria group bacterium]|nr:hypothetical protein [Patescibacteria group bacterium]